MAEVLRGTLDGRHLRIGVVQSRFNETVTERLLQGALRGLEASGVSERNIRICSVPGAVEIPIAAQAFAKSGLVDAVVALGAVIRGETAHFDYVCRMVADGCQRTSLEFGLPVAFGVLTVDDEEQALARAAGDPGSNKGFEAANAAVEMVRLLRRIPG